MIVSDKFVWCHIGKAAGTTTSCMFYIIKDAIDHNIDMNEQGFLKHDSIKKRVTFYNDKKSKYTEEYLNTLDKILNIRRLPNYIMSIANHGNKYHNFDINKKLLLNGYYNNHKNSHVDEILKFYIEDKEPTYWLRTENINKDFINVIKNYYNLNCNVIKRLLKIKRNVNKDYNKDIFNYFTSNEIMQLYRNAPLWSYYERKVYGNLLYEINNYNYE